MKCTSIAQQFHPRLLSWAFSSLLCVLAGYAPLSAEPIPLSDLLDGGSIVSGDKEFSEFTYASTGDMPTADRVNVILHQDADMNFGLRFQGGFLDLPGNGASDALITYKVNVTDPGRMITGAHIAANVVSPPDGTGTITESFLPIFNATDEVLRIPTVDGLNTDSIVFPDALSELTVQKNILLSARDDGQVDMSFVDQTFEQVPEPVSAAMLIAGWLMVCCFTRRR